MNGLVLALALTLPAAAMARKPPKKDMPMQTDGQYGTLEQPGHKIIADADTWAKFWKELGKPAPAADFSTQFAVAAFAGTRNTGGYKIVFDEPVEENGALVVRYAVVKPPKGAFVTMALTHPYSVKLFPKTSKPVTVEGREQ